MTGEVRIRLTVDEIEQNADGELVATLVTDDGRVAVVPLALLPDGTRVDQVIDVTFAASDAGSERRRLVRHLQHRLFNRDCQS